MNKTAIKNYAVWARTELMKQVAQKAYEYEVTESNLPTYNTETVRGRLLSSAEKKQLNDLIVEVKKNGYRHVIEEIAYTWFNRFIALRYMEVNNYLPQKIRVFTNENNEFKPELLSEAIHVELNGLDKKKVFQYIEENKQEDLYKYLLLTLCNDMHQYLPDMFTSIQDYKALLLPSNLLKDDSVLSRLITDIDEDSWKDQVQIIGWLYQYYNSELKDEVMKKKDYTKDDIPAVTQLFTPDWIVRYMTENSLGRLWLDGHSNFDHSNWKYYLEEAKQEPEVIEQLNKIKEEHAKVKPEDIKVIDPCMGSGHILVYAFDVLMDIYRDNGYSDRDATRSILENNLYGLEIDERAYHLAYFALMMKARSYNRRILNTETKYNLVEIREPIGVIQAEYKEYLGEYNELAQYLVNVFRDAKELGSILNLDCTLEQLNALKNHLNQLNEEAVDKDLIVQTKINELNALVLPLIKQARLLVQKYDVVITNPPYMAPDNKQKSYVQKNYPDSKSDLFAVFIEKGISFAKDNGYSCLVTMQSWMFLSSYEKLRTKLINNYTLTNLMHMDNMVMHIAFGTAVSCFNKVKVQNYKGTYNQVKISDLTDDTPTLFPNKSNRFAQISTENFSKIPGSPIAYWISKKMVLDFLKAKPASSYAEFKHGMSTGKNDEVVRMWHEVNYHDIAFGMHNHDEFCSSSKKFVPYNKGGEYRKWYGNQCFVLGYDKHYNLLMDSFSGHRHDNKESYFIENISWSKVTSGKLAMRYFPEGFVFDVAGCSAFMTNNYLYYFLGYYNSLLSISFISSLSPTLNYEVGQLRNSPIIYSCTYQEEINNIVGKCIASSKYDWNSFENSWDFKAHPLVKNHVSTISEAYNLWSKECEDRFNTLKSNEEELNRIFIDIYGLQDELDPYVEDKDVTVRKADLVRDVKSFISYAVGCMFGRYSLDKEGLIFAGGDFDKTYWKYKGEAALNLDGSLPSGGSYAGISLANLHYGALRNQNDCFKSIKLRYEPDVDDIIPICDEEYFEDDIVTRFVEFVKAVYGVDTLEENLQFIANALGGKGTPREVLRNYFLNDFFKDHCNTYQVTGSGKRPIYWLFDSGKKNGFKALVYTHRYTPDLIARMRTGYIHPLQARYRTQIEMLHSQINDATSTSEKVKLSKQLKKIQEQLQELSKYEEVVHHWADKMEPMDLDDGVKVNYAKFQELLAKIK